MSAVFYVLGIITAAISAIMIVMVFRSSAYVEQIIPALSIMHSQNLLMTLGMGLGVVAALFFSAGAIVSAIQKRDLQ